MIGSFRHKGLKEFFETGSKRGIPPELAARIARRPDVLEAAQEIGDIDAHGFKLHPLKGERQDEWSISVSGNWRITFRFVKGETLDINLEDYHWERRWLSGRKEDLHIQENCCAKRRFPPPICRPRS